MILVKTSFCCVNIHTVGLPVPLVLCEFEFIISGSTQFKKFLWVSSIMPFI